MKKGILLLVLAVLLAAALSAQANSKALGLRFGYDAQEISYQLPLNDTKRLELTLGVNTFGRNTAGNFCRGAALNGVYQFVSDLSAIANGLNWYVGVGAAALLHGDLFGVGALGQIGIEYNFNSPIQLSLDYRPGFYYLPGTVDLYRFSWNAPCFAVRYRF